MKTVGILLQKTITNNKNEGYILYKGINDYLIKNNIIPLGISSLIVNDKLNKKMLKKILKLCDGVILQGGEDFDKQNLEIVKYLHKKNIPTLGICLGMQMMACSFNGNLKLVKNHNKKSKYVHFVYLKKNNKLYKIIKKKKILVNSRHNYAVENSDLKNSANSDVIEAVCDDSKNFFIGVQWHPESLDDINSYKLFHAFFRSLKKK